MKNQEIAWNKLYKQGLSWKKNSKGAFSIKNKTVLELGVGTGKTLRSIIKSSPKKVVAIDISEEAIKTLKETKNIQLIKSDFLRYRTNEKFEIIVCYYFLNNLLEKNRLKAINKMKSLLKKDGVILFEDFGRLDFRNKGKEIEKDTIQKQNGLICHFFEKNEIKELFNGLKINVKEKQFNPIRKNKAIKRHIIKAEIKFI